MLHNPPSLLPVNPLFALRRSYLAVQRYFTTLTPALSQYLSIPAWKPSTSFTISRDFATTASDDEFLGGEIEGAETIVVDIFGGKVRTFCFVGTTFQGSMLEGVASAHNDGKLRNATVTWNDATNIAELFIDGVSAGTATWLIDGNQDVKYIGKRGTSYGSNTIGEIKLTDGVDDRWYKVNENWVENDVLVNHAAVLGAELLNPASFVFPVDITDEVLSNGVWTFTGYNTWGQNQAVGSAALVAGETYVVEFSLLGEFNHRIAVKYADAETNPPEGFAGNTYYGSFVIVVYPANRIVFTVPLSADVTGGSISITSANAGNIHLVPLTLSLLSAREAPGYGQFINGTSADAELFTEHKELSPDEWWNAFAPNLLKYSEQIGTGSGWRNSDTVPCTIVENAVADPSGEITADKISPSTNDLTVTTANNSGSRIWQEVYRPRNIETANSLYIKSVSGLSEAFGLHVVSAGTDNIVASEITTADAGWKPISATGLPAGATTGFRMVFKMARPVYVCWAQAEEHSFATAYKKTEDVVGIVIPIAGT